MDNTPSDDASQYGPTQKDGDQSSPGTMRNKTGQEFEEGVGGNPQSDGEIFDTGMESDPVSVGLEGGQGARPERFDSEQDLDELEKDMDVADYDSETDVKKMGIEPSDDDDSDPGTEKE